MIILVTGGSGFIGTHVVKRLLRDPAVTKVRSLDSNPPREESHFRGVESLCGSIENYEVCRKAVEGVDSVIHLAALASVPASVAAPAATTQTNVTGTLNVLEACREAGGAYVVTASSSAVYGNRPDAVKHEDLPTEFLSPYAASKGAAEGYSQAYAAAYGMKTLAFRFFNVFGPGQPADHPYAAVIPRFMDALLNGRPLEVFGDGTQTRDFVSVRTVADALTKSAVRQVYSAQPVNLASGTTISVQDLVTMIERIHGEQITIAYKNPRPGDVLHSSASIDRLAQLIPDLETVTISEALNEVYSWFHASRIW